MEKAVPSETSMNVHHITWRHIPEDDTLHNYCSENLESNKLQEVSIYNLSFQIHPPFLFLITCMLMQMESPAHSFKHNYF
jgi:hypothetical protein